MTTPPPLASIAGAARSFRAPVSSNQPVGESNVWGSACGSSDTPPKSRLLSRTFILVFWHGEPFRQPRQMGLWDAWKGHPILSRAREDDMPITAKVRENQPGRTEPEFDQC